MKDAYQLLLNVTTTSKVDMCKTNLHQGVKVESVSAQKSSSRYEPKRKRVLYGIRSLFNV